ncbi:MAG: hypothetical protein ACI9WL_001160 [Rubritalea sp.]|jgi:hypothetical protein
MPAIVYYNLTYVEVFVFDKYLIAQVKKGALLQPENNAQLKELIEKHYSNKNFVYLSNRAFDYNVSPVTYIETSKITNLLGMCIVTETVAGRRTANFESKFYSKDFLVVDNLPEAIDWAVELVDQADQQYHIAGSNPIHI